MAGVFISYRREDTSAHAGRLYDRLAARYGKHRVFRDLDAIPLATDFREKINEAMGSSSALIVVIGRDWLTITEPSGGPRLHNPRDWLRVEIATAIRMKKVIIPVLVEDAKMPSEDSLPDPLKPLAYISALEVSEDRWDYDVGLLIAAIEQNTDIRPEGVPGRVRPRDNRRGVAYALMIAGMAARIIGGVQPVGKGTFVSADLAAVALVAVILAVVARGPRLRLVAAGMVVGSGIGTFLRFGQTLAGTIRDDLDVVTLVLYIIGLGSGVLLVLGGALLYSATPKESQPSIWQTAAASLLGFLGVAALVYWIVASGERIFVIRRTTLPAVMPVGLTIVALLVVIGMLSSPRFWAMGAGVLIVIGLQAILRFLLDLDMPDADDAWIGIGGGALVLGAGLLGSLRSTRTAHAASLATY
jgi:TIR domain